VCGRLIAATADGGAWRHGRRDSPCPGSRRPLLALRRIKYWGEGRRFGV